jgi:Uma2 family endonuclease
MATRLQVPVEEYLSTSFSPDCEYLDGEIRERHVGEYPHSEVQFRLIMFFGRMAASHPVYPAPELRVQVAPTRYRVADLAVFLGERPDENVPSRPPLVVVEIVSREDRYVEITEKLEEYRRWGVPHVWLVDPWLRRLLVHREQGLQETGVLDLPELATRITASEIFS